MYAGTVRIGDEDCRSGGMAINSPPRDDRGFRQQIGFGFQGCKSGAKWSTVKAEIPKAEATAHLELRANREAREIEQGAAGKITGVLDAFRTALSPFERRASSPSPAPPSRARGSC
ncbi:MAG: hypothetical protein ACLFTG_01730 [Alphaproteobacteria bacterium]